MDAFLLFPLVVGGGLVAGMSLYRRNQAGPLIAACEAAADVVDVKLGLLGGVRVHLRRGSFECSARAKLPGKNTPGTWAVRVTPIAIAERTTFALSNEGVLSSIASSAGFSDIQLGEPHLDDLLRIKGSDEDVVRALMLNDDVQTAARAALDAGDAYGGPLRINRDRTLTYRTRRADYLYDTLRARTDTMLDLAEALHRERHTAPQPPPRQKPQLPPRSGVGGASGAPTGVRVI